MAVRIEDRTASFLVESTKGASLALRFIAEDIVRTSTSKTPKRTGALRRDVVKQVLGLHGEIRWGKDYAERQESTQFRRYTTSGTGPHFAENAVTAVAARADEHFHKARLV